MYEKMDDLKKALAAYPGIIFHISTPSYKSSPILSANNYLYINGLGSKSKFRVSEVNLRLDCIYCFIKCLRIQIILNNCEL